jgi:tRNA(Ile2)-agmatinylcytidine synthase
MTVVGLDDTDSRERGLCTTYLATLVAEELGDDAVRERLLVRLNPAVERKTRGNAALALHVDCDPETAFDAAVDAVERHALVEDPATSPGVVVAPGDPDDVPEAVAAFARAALRDHHGLDDALALADRAGYRHRGWAGGHGRIGALAAVGAHRAFEEWTYERVAYRAFERCGTPREVDRDSLFAAAEEGYPDAWDTVDRATGEAVCVPNAPGPVLYGIRGDDPAVVESVAAAVDGERVDRASTFRTNQGTDAHLRSSASLSLPDGRAYRVDGAVVAAPERRRGGHVHLTLGDGTGDDAGSDDASDDANDGDRLPCVAFEPTGRFRDRVMSLRVGDRVTACGEVGGGTLKLEKFAVRELVRTERVTPACPACGRSMESAGRGQGYRCRDCGETAPGRAEVPLERDLELGWYEVPPTARRHVAKPLVRGGFDAPVHPER